MQVDLSAYDFVDFGCSSGDSIAFGMNHLGGHRGLGLDINPNKVDAARTTGFDAEVVDVTKLDPSKIGTVRFVIKAHFLEHLPGRKAAQACIDSACSIADEFVFIRQPYFDADGYLFSLKLKLYWSDWTGHPNHMTTLDLYNIPSRFLEDGKISRFLIFFRSKIEDSRHAAVHPLSSPKNQHRWDPEVHDPKPGHNFTFPVFHETGAIIFTKSKKINDDIEKFLCSCNVVFDSDDAAAPSRPLKIMKNPHPNRKEDLLLGLDLPNLRGVEIGPLDKPIVLRKESSVLYADHADAESLREKYSADASVNVDAIPDIDIVLSGKTLVDHLGCGSVDYIVASHTIQHAPDFVAFLKDAHDVLRVGGVLFLAVPDHRYTFDVFRRPSFFEDVEAAHDSRATRPSLDQVLDHAKNVVELDLGLAWKDYRHAHRSARLKHPRSNIPRLAEKHQSGEYLDVHCWIFTPWSFLGLTKKVCEQYDLPMGLRRFVPTRPMKNEFLVQLEKLLGFEDWAVRWPEDGLREQDDDGPEPKK